MINIGKVVYRKLQELVKGKCYPLVADLSTTFPFIVYQKNSTVVMSTKDFPLNEFQHNLSIKIVSDKYDEAAELADEALKIMMDTEGDTIDDIEVTQVALESVTESYVEDAFVQTINLVVDTN